MTISFANIATRCRQENVPGMAHRIGVPATTSHASEEEKCLTKKRTGDSEGGQSKGWLLGLFYVT